VNDSYLIIGLGSISSKSTTFVNTGAGIAVGWENLHIKVLTPTALENILNCVLAANSNTNCIRIKRFI